MLAASCVLSFSARPACPDPFDPTSFQLRDIVDSKSFPNLSFSLYLSRKVPRVLSLSVSYLITPTLESPHVLVHTPLLVFPFHIYGIRNEQRGKSKK